MNFKTNKEKGNSSLGMAIAYFATNGYVVSIPLNDTQDYDLVIEKDNNYYGIQVKATACKTHNINDLEHFVGVDKMIQIEPIQYNKR